MRTTVSIQDSLLEKAKEAARRRKCTLGNIIEDALRRSLLTKLEPRKTNEFELTTFKGEGLQPGVNLDSHAELLDRMENR